jgi:ElaA protein
LSSGPAPAQADGDRPTPDRAGAVGNIPAVPDLRHCRGDALDAATLYALLALRSAVFVVEQACAYQDLDGRDLAPDTDHVWFVDEAGAPVAMVRVLAEPGGRRRIGRVVTRPDVRGRGLAGDLLRHVLDTIGPVETVLDAQSHLRAFYEGLGYEVDGAEFVEDGIPHLPMRRPAR